jgi:hypothetical protein
MMMMMLSDFVNKVAQLDQDVARLKEVEYHACSFFFSFCFARNFLSSVTSAVQEPVILRGRIENFEKQREALLLNFSNMDRESRYRECSFPPSSSFLALEV